jgi:catechol 2,3-dioxygenase-like lactoylglutathione lyase family enzyme
MLHHVEIYVSDLKRSSLFWGWFLETLGYTPFQSWDSGISWKLGDTYLVFVQTEAEHLDIPYHRKRTGLNHLAFHADSRVQVDEIAVALKDRGVSILYKEKHPHAGGKNYAVFFEDPDRVKVELVAPG